MRYEFPSHLRDKACTCTRGNQLSQKRLKGMHIPSKDPRNGLRKHLWLDTSVKTLYVSLISAQVMVYQFLSFPYIYSELKLPPSSFDFLEPGKSASSDPSGTPLSQIPRRSYSFITWPFCGF